MKKILLIIFGSIAALVLIYVLIWGYIGYQRAQYVKDHEEIETQVISTDSITLALRVRFQAAIAHLDMLKDKNDSLMNAKNKDINILKAEISAITSKYQLNGNDAQMANDLINKLDDKLDSCEEEITDLKFNQSHK